MIQPDSPAGPMQKYRLTDAGKRALESNRDKAVKGEIIERFANTTLYVSMNGVAMDDIIDLDDKLPEMKHTIFDPDYFCAANELIYKDQISVLSDMRIWSIELFKRVYKQIEKNAHELMIVTVLFKQTLVAFDSAILCLEHCAINAAMQHARSLFESRLYLSWVLHSQNDKQYLGRQIYVSTKRHELRSLKRLIPGNPECIKYEEAWKQSGRDYSPVAEDELSKFKDTAAKIEELLEKEIYTEINQSFEKKSKKNEVPWYIPGKYGVTSIFKLAEKLNKLPEYLYIYGLTSFYTHGAVSFVHSKFLSGGKHQIEPIRTVEGFPTAFNLITNDMLFVIELMIREYRDGEIENFKKQYRHWEPRLKGLPEFEIRVKENLI